MSSLRSRLLISAMRNRTSRQAWDWETSIPDFRQQCENGAARMKMPDGVSCSSVAIPGLTEVGGRQAEWLLPENPMQGKAILYMVGGGYVSGSCRDHRALVAKLTKKSRVATLLFDHRLAPEEPFPAALEDALIAYQWLLEQGVVSKDIVIAGDSAGGGLCLATLIALRDKNHLLPAGAVAMSPWTDLALTGTSLQTKLDVSIDPPGMSRVCSRYYVGDMDPRHPWISPLYAELQGLPPLYISVGSYETLLDDSTRFAEKAQRAGVDVTLNVGEGMVHCYPLLAPLFPEATKALADIASFVQTKISL